MKNNFSKIIQFLNEKYLTPIDLIKIEKVELYKDIKYKHFKNKKDFVKYRIPAVILYEEYQQWYLKKMGTKDVEINLYLFKSLMTRLRFQLHNGWQFAKSRLGKGQVVSFTPLIRK